MCLILAGIFYLYCVFLLIKIKKEDRKIPLWCMGIYLGIILLALIVSLTMGSAILLNRYLLIISGLVLIAISYFLAKSKNYILKSILTVILLFNLQTFLFAQENYSVNKGVSHLLKNIQENDIVLYSDVINGAVLTTYISPKVNNVSCFYNKENWNVKESYQALLLPCK